MSPLPKPRWPKMAANPMTYEEVADKFRECGEFARFPREKAESVVAMVRDLETLPSIDRLMSALRPS